VKKVEAPLVWTRGARDQKLCLEAGEHEAHGRREAPTYSPREGEDAEQEVEELARKILKKSKSTL